MLYQLLGGGLLLYLLGTTWVEVRQGKNFLYEVVEAFLGGFVLFGMIYAIQFRNPLAGLIPLVLYVLYRMARGGFPGKGFVLGVIDDLGDGFLLALGLLMLLEKVTLTLHGISFSFFVG